MKKIFLKYIFVTLALFAVSCEDDDKGDVSVTEFLTKYSEQQVFPQIDAVISEIVSLETAGKSFTATPNTKTLEAVKKQWLQTAKTYSRLRIYGFGSVKDRFHHKFTFNFPVNTTKIDNFLVGPTESINTKNINNSSSTSYGLSAVEYLLFKDNEANTLTNFTNNPNYSAYLTTVLTLAKDHMESYKSLWTDYNPKFISNGGTGTGNAFAKSFNEIVNQLVIAQVTKFEKPAGLGKSDNIKPGLLEAFRSGNSLALIKENIQSMEFAYFGNESVLGFQAIVDPIDENNLSEKIKEAFTQVYADIDNVSNPLKTALTNDAEDVKKLHTSLGTLHRYLALDVSSLLSVTVVPADIDGD